MGYAPIESYGLIGNMRTAALVGGDGSIDWLCLPRFDAPSVFGAILDDRKGGSFKIAPVEKLVSARQYYWPATNVLITRFRTEGAVAELIDFMPVGLSVHDRGAPDLVRLVRVEHGTMRIRADCRPAFDYARAGHSVDLKPRAAVMRSRASAGSADAGPAGAQGGPGGLVLSATAELGRESDAVAALLTLGEGQCAAFALHHLPDGDVPDLTFTVAEARELLDDTLDYWRQWISRCTYRGRWREVVHRSALALKLLTYEPTGAIVAAPTCSLPEHIGGGRNWDYRYTWLRDAAFTVYALLRIGFTQEAARFIDWLQERCHELEPGRLLRPLYGIDGRHEVPEQTLDHLDGYMGSRPVRIGNGAYEQLQLDITGAVMDAVYLYNKHAAAVSDGLWRELRRLLDWTCQHWEDKDAGVWEVRGEPRDFVYSKLMCWVALDRGIRLAAKRSFPGDVDLWRSSRDRIYDQIMDKGWSAERRAFVQHYGADTLDAANLIMPLVFFVSPNDPKMLSTIRAMDRPPDKGGLVPDFLVMRYDPSKVDDGLGEPEGEFNMCTFWLIEAMTRAGRTDRALLERARILFDRVLRLSGPLGLFSEQMGKRGNALGNYPQGLTHLSLISAAFNLDRALGDRP